MITSIVMTVIGKDHPGIVNSLSSILTRHQGNWNQSSMSSLAGQFAGILRATVPDENAAACIRDLEDLGKEGLRVIAQVADAEPESGPARRHILDLVGHDRPGIVNEITRILTQHGVNIIQLETEVASASMAGGPLFRASVQLDVPETTSMPALRGDLEEIANELMVDFRAQG